MLGNIEQVLEIKELILLFEHQTFDSVKYAILYKTLKATKLAIANYVVLSHTNTVLLAANIQKKTTSSIY